MKRFLKIIALVCIFVLFCSQTAFCRVEISTATAHSHASAQPLESRLPPIEYPLIERDGVLYSTLSHLQILEILPEYYQDMDGTFASSDPCILCKAEVINDLFGALSPGEIVYLEIRPSSERYVAYETTLDAAKEQLPAMDSCFVYSRLDSGYRGISIKEEGTNHIVIVPYETTLQPISLFGDYVRIEEDAPPIITTSPILCPNISGGAFLPIVDDHVDADALTEFGDARNDFDIRAFEKARNIDKLEKMLLERADPDYYEKQKEQQQQSRESYENTTTLLGLAIVAVVGTVFLIGSLYHLIQKLCRRS